MSIVIIIFHNFNNDFLCTVAIFIHAFELQCRMKLRFFFWENSVETLPKYCVKWERTKEEKQTKKNAKNTNVTAKTIYFDEPNWFVPASPSFMTQNRSIEICWLILFGMALIPNSFHVISIRSKFIFHLIRLWNAFLCTQCTILLKFTRRIKKRNRKEMLPFA